MPARSPFSAIALACAASAAAETPTPPPAATTGQVSTQAEIIALEEERHNRLTMPVMVEGTGPFAFMIDTGSQATAITHEIRTLANLAPAGRATLVGMASRREVELATIGRIEFGTNSYTNFAAPVLEREHVGADGIIGLDVDITGELAFVRTLSIEGLSLTDVPLTFADTPAFAALGLQDQPVLSLGMQHLALFDRVAIDFEKKRIMFDVPADIARAVREAQQRLNYVPRF